LFAVLALTSGCQQADETPVALPTAPDEEDPLEPEELVTQMATFLAAHNDYSFEALVTYESLQESGQTLHFDMMERVAVSQPDRLFWATRHDDARSDSAWYSAGQFIMLKQPENIYGQIDVPATIPEMIDVVTNDYGIIVPFSDLLAGGDESVFLRDLQASDYVGLAWVEGRWSHHLALRNELVDFELWMQVEGDPIPLKITITWKLEEGRPTYVARFREWKFSPVFDESQFDFDAPDGAELIEVLPRDVAWEVER
jgi:hypothetical protein